MKTLSAICNAPFEIDGTIRPEVQPGRPYKLEKIHHASRKYKDGFRYWVFDEYRKREGIGHIIAITEDDFQTHFIIEKD